jgi:hypothetical protein
LFQKKIISQDKIQVMKTVKTILLIAVLISCANVFAQNVIRRVDGNAANGAPYTTIQAAVDAAVAGDTIHIVGCATSYAGANITKQLVLIGPGYFLGENIDTQNNKSPAKVSGVLWFKAGSSGSFVMGLHFTATSSCIDLDAVNNMVIKRNYFNGDGAVRFNVGSGTVINNTTIQQNYFRSHPVNYSSSATNNTILLLNNYIGGNINGLWGSTLTVKQNIIETSETSAFNNGNQISNSEISNNIIIIHNAAPISGLGSANSVLNNLCNTTVLGIANGNQQSVDMTTVFVIDPAAADPSPYTSDSRYQLAAGSPAIGAGASGEDCGIFGGSDPYVLSGLPAIPAIYEITAPTSATQAGGLNVTIKAKSH